MNIMTDRKAKIRAHYEHRITSDRAGFSIADWTSAETQRARFEVFAENVNVAGKSLLDIGCGTGDLLAFLQLNGIAADYTGVDILEKMVRESQKRNPAGRFICADIFCEDAVNEHPICAQRFDVVFCSGAFNLNLGNKHEFLPRALGRMFDLAREHVVFNLLHARSEFRDRVCVYYNPVEIRRILEPYDSEIRIIEDYLPNDFTVICRKNHNKTADAN